MLILWFSRHCDIRRIQLSIPSGQAALVKHWQVTIGLNRSIACEIFWQSGPTLNAVEKALFDLYTIFYYTSSAGEYDELVYQDAIATLGKECATM